VKVLGKARNDLVKHSKNNYLLFVDCGIYFSKTTFETYIKPAIQKRELLIYRGENNILCTKVFGISRKFFYDLGGFDETFHIGEDLEFGLRIPSWIKRIEIPKCLVDHREHEKRANYLNNLCVRVRLALRYNRSDLLKVQRKKDFLGVFLIPFLLTYYVWNNKRRNIDV
jgi:predicted glycosyltransferase involved in capsule biosynthesis